MDADNEFLANVDIELLVAEHNREKESLLLSLPNELIDKIYQCSDPTGRHALMHTCRQVDQWSRWLWGYSWTLLIRPTATPSIDMELLVAEHHRCKAEHHRQEESQ